MMKKRLWSPEEDEKLNAFVSQHGTSKWREVPLRTGLDRSGKSCRLRWVNHLRPGIRRGDFPAEEENLVFQLQSVYGNRWSLIAQLLPGRTDNEVKNFWRVSAQRSAKNYERSLSLQQMTSYRLAVPFKVGFDEPDVGAQVQIQSFNEPNVAAQVQTQSPVTKIQQNIAAAQSHNVCSSLPSISNTVDNMENEDFICESLWEWDETMQFELVENPPIAF